MASSGTTGSYTPPRSPLLFEGKGEDGALTGEHTKASEEDVLDQLFLSCASTQEGSVDVEDIIDRVKGVVSADNQGYMLELLERMMRDSASEGRVNFSCFQHVIRHWVEAVKRQQSESVSPPRSHSSLSISQMSGSSRSENEVDQSSAVNQYTSQLVTLEASGAGDSLVDGGIIHNELDLVQSVQQLEYANERLVEMNQKLQLQMESSEERLVEMGSDNEQLKKSLRQVQQTLEQRNTLVSDLQKELEQAHIQDDAVNLLQHEKRSLQEELTKCEQQLQQVQNEMASLRSDSDHQLLTLQQGSHDHTSLHSLRAQLEETEIRNEDLTTALNELNDTHEAVRAEKEQLDNKVAELEVELASRSHLGGGGMYPVYVSTPYNAHGALVGRCLKDEMGDHLPSYPNYHMDSLDVSGPAMDQSSLLASLSPIPGGSGDLSSMDHFSIIASQARSQFRQKKELALKQISELFTVAPSNNMESRKEVLRLQLEDDMQSFEGKLTQLSQSKHLSEKRVTKLTALIRKMKAEIKRLEIERAEAKQLIQSSSDSAYDQLKDKSDHNQNLQDHVTGLQDHVIHLEEEVATSKAELQKRVEQLDHVTAAYEQKLQRAVKQEAEWGVSIAAAARELDTARERCVQLEESLDVTVTSQRAEMEGLLELVLAEMANAEKELPANMSAAAVTSVEDHHGDRSLPPTSVRIKELVTTGTARLVSALRIYSGNLKLLKWADGDHVSLQDSDDEDTGDTPKQLVSKATNSEGSVTGHAPRKQLIHQLESLDEEPLPVVKDLRAGDELELDRVRSLSVTAMSQPQLKSILHRSAAGKSLSLDLHHGNRTATAATVGDHGNTSYC